jgi:putative tricarboxylic transport membrane protein
MAKKGRAGPALGISAMGSFIGGTIAIIGLMFLAFPLARAALKFGAPEFFSVMVLAMTILAYMAVRSAVNAFLMILGCVGMDPVSGIPRFFFGSPSLLDGIGVVPGAMGVFGVSEVFSNIGVKEEREILKTKIKNILPNLDDWRKSIGPIWRGSIIGFFLGILPGAGSIMSTFVSYTMEKKLSRRPEEFGRGAIEGVAGPETANNAGAGGAFVPMLALGIPPTAVMALLLSALIIHGVTPGPLLLKQHPEIFWGVIASMYMGNLALLVLNLPLVGLWVQVLKVPSKLLLPLILLICLTGVYTINNNVTDIAVMTIFGVAGYILRIAGYELAPLIMALVLGPLMETNWRSALILSDGSLSIFVTRPISVTCLAISALLLLSTVFTTYRKAKKRVVEEAGEGD